MIKINQNKYKALPQMPLFPASGVFPMDADLWKEIGGCDAICTKGITCEARAGNGGQRLYETPSGLLNSIGLENPGVRAWINEYCEPLFSSGKKIILNLACETLASLEEALGALEAVKDKIFALELNLSCPNVDGGGQVWGQSKDAVKASVSVARKSWGGVLWVKLTPQAGDFVSTALQAQESGADALVVANTWLGCAMDIHARSPFFDRTFAGLSGPAVFPLALRLVYQTYERVKNIPIIASGGVRTAEDAIAMTLAGASAVELGTELFRDFSAIDKINKGLEDYLAVHSASCLDEIVGAGHG